MINRILHLLCATALMSTTMIAGNFSFRGVFGSDDQIQTFNFAISSAATVTIEGYAYGGGTNSAGAVIPAGGFDTLVTIFNGDGTGAQPYDDDPGCGHSHFRNGACLDSYFSGSLAAGSYIVALTESGNFAIGDFSDGFTQQGTGNFTDGNCPSVSTQGFCDVFGNQDNANWALDIKAVSSASQTPEPVSLSLTGLGLALLGIVLWRRNFKPLTN